MMNRYRLAVVFTALALVGPLRAQTPGTGRIHIRSLENYSAAAALVRPSTIVVYDFVATPDDVKLNSARLSRLRTRLSGDEEAQKTQLAHELVSQFSQSLIKHLEHDGWKASIVQTGEIPPDGALAVQGKFTVIDEGNRAKRMAVGLGAGASKVVADVTCYLKQTQKNVTLTKFQAVSESSRKPGAAETMGAGAAPEMAATASGVTELKQGAEGDSDRMAKAVAKEIVKSMAAQGWVEQKK